MYNIILYTLYNTPLDSLETKNVNHYCPVVLLISIIIKCKKEKYTLKLEFVCLRNTCKH